MSDSKNFVSCIKVKGTHFLPPVITPTLRLELEKYRQQAVKLEKRLQSTRELKKNLEELLIIRKIFDRPRSAVTFSDDSSHINDLGILSARGSAQSKRIINLTKDILDVSEYNNDGIKVISRDMNAVIQHKQGQLNEGSQVYETDESSIKLDDVDVINLHSQSTSSKESFSEISEQLPALNLNKLSNETDYSRAKSPKGRLIRSNSYTLEAPSPILLAHLEKCSKSNVNDTETPNLSKDWVSLENNYIPFENSEFSSLNTVYNLSQNEENEIKVLKDGQPEKDSPCIEVVQTDISVQQITLNANSDQPEPIKTSFELTDPDCQLMQILKKMPEDYSQQIIELIEKQRQLHLTKVQNFDKMFPTSPKVRCSTPLSEQPQDNQSSISAISASPSQSIYYSVCSSDTIIPDTTLGQWETCSDKHFTDEFVAESSKNIDIADDRIDPPNSFSKMITSNNHKNGDREKKDWAASIIGAYVKGYLTRRLFKTDRVQSLIQTIRDALLCALQLHAIENIDEADIELHRRLINQVSAACYAFHDIFFSLSIPEKMAIISADRKRKTEKSRRPRSTSDLRRSMSNSSRSSTKSVRTLTHSLTNI